jgi:uncharacterized protein (TIGR00266 family)
MPVLEMDLQPGESVISEAGELSWMTSSIQMQTSTQMGGGGGVFGAFKRMASGGTLFMTEYKAEGKPGTVAFATKVPGTILAVDVTPGKTHMIHRHGFLCATPGAELTIGFQQSLGAGIFGGAGFRLQKLAGNCTAWVELSGELVTYELGPGEVLRVHPGHVGMFEQTIAFEITRIKGIKNMMFGSDGVFLAQLTGPGKVWLQSLPLPNLAHALSEFIVVREAEAAGAGAVVGGIIKGFSK